jgi:DNA-binding LacI/PurR family transcriptional regulator
MVLPQRLSLVSQVADILRQRLHAGEWSDTLPGEYSLCEELRVSRPTLRKALALLADEGSIRAERGMGWRILTRPRRTSRPVIPNKIGILCFRSLEEASHFSLFQIDKLRDHLHREGCAVEIHAGSQYDSQNYRHALERLVARVQASHWVLLGPGLRVQEWFRERKIPAFVSLTALETVSLPAIRVNTQAMYRHAVGMLIGKGHLRLAWVVPDVMLRPEEVRQHGFSLAVEEYAQRTGFSARMFGHDTTVAGVHRATDALLAMNPTPTALLVVSPTHALAVLTYLNRLGLRVPNDLSLLCIGYEPFLDNCTPTLAHYSIDRWAYSKRMCSAVLAWLPTGRTPAKPTVLLPRFYDGQSIAPVG